MQPPARDEWRDERRRSSACPAILECRAQSLTGRDEDGPLAPFKLPTTGGILFTARESAQMRGEPIERHRERSSSRRSTMTSKPFTTVLRIRRNRRRPATGQDHPVTARLPQLLITEVAALSRRMNGEWIQRRSLAETPKVLPALSGADRISCYEMVARASSRAGSFDRSPKTKLYFNKGRHALVRGSLSHCSGCWTTRMAIRRMDFRDRRAQAN